MRFFAVGLREFTALVALALVELLVATDPPAAVAQGGRAAEEKIPDIALKAKAVLKDNCHGCHGDGGNAANGFYVLSPRSLKSRLVPGQPEQSRLIRMLLPNGSMPKDGEPLAAEDRQTLVDWIKAGAPRFLPKPNRTFIEPVDVFVAMLKHLQSLDEDDRPFARYFTIAHLYNAGLEDDELDTHRFALSKLVNSLSWHSEITPPKAVDAARTLFYIDLTKYLWKESTWYAIVAANPYGVKFDHAAYKECAKATGSELPLVRGDWFVFAASRPPLYHSILEIPETDTLLEKTLRVDVKENLRTNQVWRSGFNQSGVSDNNRLLERHLSPMTGGAYWKSYDFKGIDQKNPNFDDPFRDLFDHPLGPDGPNAFRHDGGEIIFHLPNGLQAYMLTATTEEPKNGKPGKRLDHGRRIDTGPTDVVRDPKQKESKVVNGVSCMSCHAQGMILKNDEIRDTVLAAKPGTFTEEEVRKVKLHYKPQADFEAIQKQDAQRFKTAVEKTGSHLTNEDPIVQLSKQFEAELDVELAAAEVGLPVAKFLRELDRVPVLARKFGALKIPGRSVKRDIFVASFGDFMFDLGLGTFISRIKSGVSVGEPVPFVNVRAITGPNKGWLCYHYCKYGALRPVVTIFTRELNDDVKELIRQIDAKVDANKDAKMAALVMVMTDSDAVERKLEAFAKDAKINNVPLTIMEDSDGPVEYKVNSDGSQGPASGPAAYKISKNAAVTVMMWTDNKMKVNRAYAKGQLDKNAIESLLAETKTILE